jgi:hypothetical protein
MFTFELLGSLAGLGAICALEEDKKIGWGLLIASNIFLSVWSLLTGSWGYLTMQIVYTIIAIRGLLKKKEEK